MHLSLPHQYERSVITASATMQPRQGFLGEKRIEELESHIAASMKSKLCVYFGIVVLRIILASSGDHWGGGVAREEKKMSDNLFVRVCTSQVIAGYGRYSRDAWMMRGCNRREWYEEAGDDGSMRQL